MDRKRLGSRHLLLFVSGAMLGSSCLDTAPLQECFEIAEEEPADEIEVFSVGVKSGEECPKEGAREVKDTAQEHADRCSGGAKLQSIACGPLEEYATSPGLCTYVAVYNKRIGGCAFN
jgi:hypothetical protein